MTTCFFNNGKLYADSRVSGCNGDLSNSTFKVRSLSHTFQDEQLGEVSYFGGAGSLRVLENILLVKSKLMSKNPELTFKELADAIYAGLLLTDNHTKFIFTGVRDGEVGYATLNKDSGLTVRRGMKVGMIGSGASFLKEYEAIHEDDPMRMMQVATVCDKYTNAHWTILDPLKHTMKHVVVKPSKKIIDAINKKRIITYDADFS